jgi:hypothetical protein
MAVWISVWHFGLTKPKTRALNSPGVLDGVCDDIEAALRKKRAIFGAV